LDGVSPLTGNCPFNDRSPSTSGGEKDFEVLVTDQERESIQDKFLDWDILTQIYDPPSEFLTVPTSTAFPDTQEASTGAAAEESDEIESTPPETESIETQVIVLDNVKENSFHDRIIESSFSRDSCEKPRAHDVARFQLPAGRAYFPYNFPASQLHKREY